MQTIFLDSRQFPVEAMATFKAQVERILRTGIVRTQEKKNVRFKLDDAILGCLAALSPKAHDEELEDLFCFILESFQFTGVPVGYDEQDEDQVSLLTFYLLVRSLMPIYHSHRSSVTFEPF